jgi:hypothetical protein
MHNCSCSSHAQESSGEIADATANNRRRGKRDTPGTPPLSAFLFPFKGNQQLVKAFSIDLSPAAVSSLAPSIEKVMADGEMLKQKIAALQRALGNITAPAGSTLHF